VHLLTKGTYAPPRCPGTHRRSPKEAVRVLWELYAYGTENEGQVRCYKSLDQRNCSAVTFRCAFAMKARSMGSLLKHPLHDAQPPPVRKPEHDQQQ